MVRQPSVLISDTTCFPNPFCVIEIFLAEKFPIRWLPVSVPFFLTDSSENYIFHIIQHNIIYICIFQSDSIFFHWQKITNVNVCICVTSP